MTAAGPRAWRSSAGGSNAGLQVSANRRRFRTKVLAPYALLGPALVVIGLVLAVPLYKLIAISLQQYGLRELLAGSGPFIGLENYRTLVTDSLFWTVVARTGIFAAVNVTLTMVLGMGIALLLQRVHRFLRTAITAALVAAWAMPFLVAVAIFQWMVDYEFGVLNWTLTKAHVGDFIQHNWFTNPVEGFAVITAVIVWGALPFVAITIYAALTQVPAELEEAARIDGAGAWQLFRNVTIPIIRPVLIILTSLSIIWDFQVFNQVWIMLGGKATPDYYLLSIYSFRESFTTSDFGMGAAIAVASVVMLLGVTGFYIRQMLTIGDVR